MALAGVLLAVVVLAAGVLWFQYTQILDNEQRRAENLAAILADHLARSVEGIESTLRTLALYSRQVGPPRPGDAVWQSLIETGLAGLPGARAILILDEHGTISHSTVPNARGQDRRNSPLFRALTAGRGDAVSTNALYRSTIDGTLLISFGHRLETADGRLAGVVIAAMEPSRLENFYRSVETGPNGIVWVLHPDGQSIFRSASTPAAAAAAAAPILDAQRKAPDGSTRGPLGGRSDTYVTGYRTLATPSLVIAVSFAERDLLAGWLNLATAQAIMLALIAAALIMAGLFIGREVQARSVAEERFQAILDHAPLALSVKNRDGVFTFVNRAFAVSFNLEAEAALGKTSHQIMPKLRATLAEGIDREVVDGRGAVQNEIVVEDPTAPGTERRLFMIKFPLFDARGQVESVGTIAVDVTEQQTLKEQLVHTRKMEALGQLTGGIAHDFNNLLTTMLLNSGILCSQLSDQQALTLAREINYAAERGSQLTKRLLSFGRRQWLDPQMTDIGALVESMGDMIARVLGSHINVEIRSPAAGPLHTMIDTGQLENALLNLAVNARDAMPEGGRLTIATAVRTEQTAEGAAEFVALSVTDTGSGMPPEVVARACEPFFTTKGVGKGTGLGLSMVYGFLKQSGGRVDIASEVGVGTTITLLMPRTSGDEEEGDASALRPVLDAKPRRAAAG